MKKLVRNKEMFDEDIWVNRYVNDYKEGDKNLKIIKSIPAGSKVLSLGCGSGREVKALVKQGCKVIAIDISQNMVNKSKEIEPEAIYFCEDAIEFIKRNKDEMKFDYIIGLQAFVNYLPREEVPNFIDGLKEMSDNVILDIKQPTDTWKLLLKSICAYLFDKRVKIFGDIYGVNALNHDEEHMASFWTKKQLKGIL